MRIFIFGIGIAFHTLALSATLPSDDAAILPWTQESSELINFGNLTIKKTFLPLFPNTNKIQKITYNQYNNAFASLEIECSPGANLELSAFAAFKQNAGQAHWKFHQKDRTEILKFLSILLDEKLIPQTIYKEIEEKSTHDILIEWVDEY